MYKYEAERKFLEDISYKYNDNITEVSKFVIETYISKFRNYITNGRGMELGCSYGYSTKLLSQLVDELVVIDGSNNMISNVENMNLKNVKTCCCLFEEINEDEQYDYIFANYVLEHVLDPQAVLIKCRKILKKDGVLFITVPNATALSRTIAKEMEIVDDLYNLTINDQRHGHRRVYDKVKISKEVEDAGFEIIDIDGLYIKPLSDYQLNIMIKEDIINKKYLQSLACLSKKYIELCGSICLVVKVNK